MRSLSGLALTTLGRLHPLRKLFFVIALALIVIIVLIELGSMGVLNSAAEGVSGVSSLVPADRELQDVLESLDDEQRQELNALTSQNNPPGIGIAYLALLDGIILFTIGLIALSDLFSRRVHGRIQGLATLIFSIIIILLGIAMTFVALALVILMISLLLSFPFGTLAYLAKFGSFNRTGAVAVLSLIMTLKIGFAVCLVAANPLYLKNKGLVLLIVTSLVANIILSFLHGVVPRFLVSITDGIGAIIVAILAIVWAILLLIGAIPSVIRALQISRV
jgi:hypothetical protein